MTGLRDSDDDEDSYVSDNSPSEDHRHDITRSQGIGGQLSLRAGRGGLNPDGCGGQGARNGGRGGSRKPRDSRCRGNVQDNTAGSRQANNIIEIDCDDSVSAPPIMTFTENNDIDVTCKRSHMITLMRKNDSKINNHSFNAADVKELLDLVMGRAEYIEETVRAKKPHLSKEMNAALHAKFPMLGSKRPGKLQYCEKLVDVWLLFEQVDKLMESESGRGARAINLSYFITTMRKFSELVDEKMEEDLNRLKTFKSGLKLAGEKDRLYLQGGGIALDMQQFPFCPNPKCHHQLIDQPPENATVKADNQQAMEAYIQLSSAYAKWKKRQGPQPVCPDTNEPLEKPPKAPKAKKMMLRCHCSQNGVDARQGKKCLVNCIVGRTKDLGKCPLCLCCCDAFVEMDNYQTIVMATTLGAAQREVSQEDSISYLDQHTNVNRIQQQATLAYYNDLSKMGRMANSLDQSLCSNIRNAGALAQSLSMLENPPLHNVLHTIRDRIDSIQHESGPTHTSFGDMRSLGRSSTAASDRVTNNHLELSEYIPVSMLEEDMVQQAIAASTSAGGSHPLAAGVLSAYVPPNMSYEEMMERGIAASTSNANHGIGFMLQNVEPRSTSSSGSNHADDNRKMPAFCPPIATTQSFVHRIHVPPSAIQLG